MTRLLDLALMVVASFLSLIYSKVLTMRWRKKSRTLKIKNRLADGSEFVVSYTYTGLRPDLTDVNVVLTTPHSTRVWINPRNIDEDAFIDLITGVIKLTWGDFVTRLRQSSLEFEEILV